MTRKPRRRPRNVSRRSAASPTPIPRRVVLAAFALVVAVACAYFPAARGGFIWDDDDHITANQAVQSPDGLGRIWMEVGSTPQYYPMTFTSFWVEHAVWGVRPLGYHLVNILLHGLNAVLVGLVLRRLSVPGAWLAAAIFALHPVQVETVAWITERKNLLSTSFYLASALAYLRFAGIGTDRRGAGSWGVYAVALGAFAAAVLSKTVACSLPATLMLVLWWKRGRIGARSIPPLLPMFVLGLALGLLTVWLERNQIMAEGVEWDLSPGERILIAGRALWFYLSKLVWPFNLSFVYPRWVIDANQWWQYLFPLSYAALVIGLWSGRRRIGRAPLAAGLMFAGTLVPALGFFNVYPMRFSLVADHFQYVACIAPMALTSAGVTLAISRWCNRPVIGRLAWAGLGVVLVLLAASTHARAGVYRSNETLWRDTLKKNPSAWLAHLNLGGELERRGAYVEAEEHWREVVRLGPDAHIALTNLGTMYEQRLRQTDRAIRCYREAIELQPEAHAAYNNLAWLLATHPDATVRDGAEAVRLAEQAAHLTDFRTPLILDTLAAAYAEANRFAEAVQTVDSALDLIGVNSGGGLREQLIGVRDLYRAGQPLRVER